MALSCFDFFSIGVGPSSSHTVGPMRAANFFLGRLKKKEIFSAVDEITVTLHGSLAWTGIGHATDKAILLGLLGETPEGVNPDLIPTLIEKIKNTQRLFLAHEKEIEFSLEKNLIFNKKDLLEFHSNGINFKAFSNSALLEELNIYSVGGGFIVTEEEINAVNSNAVVLPFPFETAHEILEHCKKNQFTIPELMMHNERVFRKDADIKEGLLKIWKAMDNCITRGLHSKEEFLPGGLKVRRRAPGLYLQLQGNGGTLFENTRGMDFLSAYAISVNEENASGGRVVTAPTNGAAGIIPAVLKYYTEFDPTADEAGIMRYLLTAGAIGILFKKGASISAAEVGCQGEVGVACSMAAGGLVAALQGNCYQIEHAAEMGMEHHLGLTCDPVGGLVQIPCIERNAMGAAQAVTSARIAFMEDGQHKITLDSVIKTMKATGRDMSTKYKETSQGGLALSQPEC